MLVPNKVCIGVSYSAVDGASWWLGWSHWVSLIQGIWAEFHGINSRREERKTGFRRPVSMREECNMPKLSEGCVGNQQR